MISKNVLKSPVFTGLPIAAQLLYCHLVLETDDEGFIDNVKAVQKGSGFYAKTLRILQENNFLHIFDSGVGVIIHWHWMNKIQPSKVEKTLHTAEKAMLTLDETEAYQLIDNATKFASNTREYNLEKEKEYICANDRTNICDGDDTRKKTSAVYTAEFEEVWALYPKKRDKYKAYRAYQKAKKTGVSDDDIKAGINRYRDYIARKKLKEQYIKHGSTFFNQRSWEDDYDIDIKPKRPQFDDGLIDLL